MNKDFSTKNSLCHKYCKLFGQKESKYCKAFSTHFYSFGDLTYIYPEKEIKIGQYDIKVRVASTSGSHQGQGCIKIRVASKTWTNKQMVGEQAERKIKRREILRKTELMDVEKKVICGIQAFMIFTHFRCT